MDSVIYALVLSPAMKELLPRSGLGNSPADIAFYGSILFALFLVGWGLSFVWGPIADRFGRARCLAIAILVFSVFTGAAAFAQTVWQLGLFRFLAGIGIGGEWALAGTYVAEAWPEDRRKMGAGYLQTGYYSGFFAGGGAQLHSRGRVWLARHVPVRRRAHRGDAVYAAARARAAALGTSEDACSGQSAGGDLRWTQSAPHHRQQRAGRHRHYRAVGRHRL